MNPDQPMIAQFISAEDANVVINLDPQAGDRMTETDGDLRDAEVNAAALNGVLDRQKTREHFAQSVPRWCVVTVHTLEEFVCHLCTPHIASLQGLTAAPA